MGLTDTTYGDGLLHLFTGGTLAAHRMYAFTGAPPLPALPAAGADVDCVAFPGYTDTDPLTGNPVSMAPKGVYLAIPGLPVRVMAGAAFSSGQLLQTDSSGRAIAQTTGKAVLRALEAAPFLGAVVWAVWTSGR